MKITKIKDILFIGAAMLLAGCADDEMVNGQQSMVNDPVGQPVLFSVGNLAETNTRSDVLGSASPYYHGMTNTSGVPYMALDGRFVCTMYYHAAAGDTDASNFDIRDAADGGTMTTAWLKVNNNVGNSVYWNKEYSTEGVNTDDSGNAKEATKFYWQNRLTHAFLALADYNKLTTNVGTTTNTESDKGKLKMFPNFDEVSNNHYANTYDLTRGSNMTKMTDQPDPILALTIMKPAGSTQEANRVRLYFKHQFSQIQVNIKGADDNSANITADQIDKVELLGVSTEGYVSCRLNTDGTVGAASAKDVNLDEFSDTQLETNKWGTSFEMFDMATGDLVDVDGDGIDDRYAIGFLKSFNAIAFGDLWAIRITWHEKGTTGAPGIEHVSTFKVPSNDLRQLASAKKYIYDLELRRGMLAIIRTEILDWMQKEALVYGTDGTIKD